MSIRFGVRGSTSLRALVLWLVCVPAAWAQFAGDVYFAEPSVVTASGESVTLEVLTFAGAEPFGAVHIELDFDPLELEFVSITPSADFSDEGSFVNEYADGTLSVVLANARAIDSPIGTVSLFELEVSPRVPNGSFVSIGSTRFDYLFADRSRNDSGIALGAEILVIDQGVVTAAVTADGVLVDPLEIDAGTPLYERGTRLRQQGAEFDMQLLRGNAAVTVPVRVAPDQATPSD